MSEEEYEKFMQRVFAEASDNPNAFNNWYYQLSGYLPSPRSIFIPLPYDWFCWVSSDDYAPEMIVKFGAWLRPYVWEAVTSLGCSYPLFLKSSLTSHKFWFGKTKITEDITDHDLGDSALSMIYHALCGDQFTNGVVLRQYIDPDCSLPTIYHGMPLRAEYRVFYDFDAKKVLAVVPYWERETMVNSLSYLPEDLAVFQSQADRLEREFTQGRDSVVRLVEDSLRDFPGRPGGKYGAAKWSLDFMTDGDGELWFIDAAIASMSAYQEVLDEGSQEGG